MFVYEFMLGYVYEFMGGCVDARVHGCVGVYEFMFVCVWMYVRWKIIGFERNARKEQNYWNSVLDHFLPKSV